MYGAALYYAHRVDLHEGLKRLALADDGKGGKVEVFTRKKVVGYEVGDADTKPAVRLDDGEVITADLVIAADGVHSVAVEHVLGKRNPAEVPTGVKANLCYRFLIPTKEVDGDPETGWFNEGLEAKGCRVWADIPGRKRLISYPCRE